MALTSWGKDLWQICMHHWRVQAKVEFTRFPPDVISCAMISFMGFPAILSALQPFHICTYNRKYRKLTFSNDSHLMGKALWQICMCEGASWLVMYNVKV